MRSALRKQHLSARYLFQKWGGKGKEDRALNSTSSSTRSATTTELGNPQLYHMELLVEGVA